MSGGTSIGSHKDAESISLDIYATTIGMSMLLGPLSDGRPAPWIQGGVGIYDISATRGFPSLDEQAGAAFGFGIGAGIAVEVSPKLHAKPAVRFAMFAPDFTFEDETTTRSVGTVSYLTFDVGLMYNFGVRSRR
jgi:hypothetical protein